MYHALITNKWYIVFIILLQRDNSIPNGVKKARLSPTINARGQPIVDAEHEETLANKYNSLITQYKHVLERLEKEQSLKSA